MPESKAEPASSLASLKALLSAPLISGLCLFWAWTELYLGGSALPVSADSAAPSFSALIAVVTLANILGILSVLLASLAIPVRRNGLAIGCGAIGTADALLMNLITFPEAVLIGTAVMGFSIGVVNVLWFAACADRGCRSALLNTGASIALCPCIMAAVSWAPSTIQGSITALIPLACCLLVLLLKNDVASQPLLQRGKPNETGTFRLKKVKGSVIGPVALVAVTAVIVCGSVGLISYAPLFHPTSELVADAGFTSMRAPAACVIFLIIFACLRRPVASVFRFCLIVVLGGVVVAMMSALIDASPRITFGLTEAGSAAFDIVLVGLIALAGDRSRLPLVCISGAGALTEQVGFFLGLAFALSVQAIPEPLSSHIMLALCVVQLVSLSLLINSCGAISTTQSLGKTGIAATSPEEKLGNFCTAFALSPRERDILRLLVEGRSAPFIAEELVVSGNTVKSHISHIYGKCDIHNRQELISLYAVFENQQRARR